MLTKLPFDLSSEIPTIILVVIAFFVAIGLSGLIIKAAKALGRIIIFVAIFYFLLVILGII